MVLQARVPLNQIEIAAVALLKIRLVTIPNRLVAVLVIVVQKIMTALILKRQRPQATQMSINTRILKRRAQMKREIA